MKNSSFFGKSSDNVAQAGQAVNQEAPAVPAVEGGSEHPHSSKKQLVKAAGVVGFMTLISRVLGMTRDIFTAGRFGTSWQWDAFLYAFMLPNFFRRLVGEGSLSSAFIPVYSETLQKHGKEAAFRFANVLSTLLASGLVVFLLAVEVVLHFLWKADFLDARLHLTVDLLRIFFPYLFFISLFALAMGILNCHKHFFTPALGPIILDLAWIAGVVWIVPHASQIPHIQLRWLAFILLVSGALQFAVDIPPLYKMGFRFRIIWDFAHEGLKKTGRMLIPAILGFAIVQLNMLVDMICAYFAGPGANSSLWYGTRLMQFPLGVFGIAMGTALLPALSHQVARKEIEESKKTLSFALRSMALILLPCMVGLIALRTPIIAMLFERGEFDAVSTARTASVLLFYSIGLYAFAAEKLVAAGFFAAQDTRTPVRMGAASLILNIFFNILLIKPMKESGLALATSLASVAEFVLLVYFYRRQVSDLPMKEINRAISKVLMASLAMGAVAWGSLAVLQRLIPGNHTHELMIHVFGSMAVSVAAYFAFCFIFRVHEMSEALAYIKNRKKRTPSAG